MSLCVAHRFNEFVGAANRADLTVVAAFVNGLCTKRSVSTIKKKGAGA